MSYVKKILQQKLDKKRLKTGEFVEVDVDVILSNDITTPLAIDAFENEGIDKIPYPEKIVFVADHFTPNKDIASAIQVKKVRDFARKWNLRFFDSGEGIEHILLPEKGLVLPMDVVIGADSHTCTYGALGAFATGVGSTDVASAWATGKAWFKVPPAIKIILRGELNPYVDGKDIILYIISQLGTDGACYKGLEFCGETLNELTLDSRFTISNMVIECGAKYGVMNPDRLVVDYVEKRATRPYSSGIENYSIEKDPDFDEIMEIDCSTFGPQVAFPSSPANSHPVKDVDKIMIDQVVIGSCTNGRWDDFVKAAEILKGRRKKSGLRLIVIPGTAELFKKMLTDGMMSIFVEAGAIISPPTCGPCLGGHMGILAQGEKAVATTNRNFIGRMGHKDSQVYLSNSAVAAATAITGYIETPENL